MQEKLDAPVRTQAMQQMAEPLHISKKTLYTVYPSNFDLGGPNRKSSAAAAPQGAAAALF